MSFPRYDEYKDSGGEWLGDVPAHWDVVRIKHMVEAFGAGGTPDTAREDYWATSEEGFAWVAIGDMSARDYVCDTSKRLTPAGIASKGLSVWPEGTLLFSMYASLGHVSVLKIPAATNQAILALQPNQDTWQPFLKRWFEYLRPGLSEHASSNTQDNLNAEKVKNLVAVRPPASEQTAIAAFLDRETAKIDDLVAEQQNLIALLKEKRQALISHAVTKGLNPNAPMKDSGVEWLGEVPAHWFIMPLSRITLEKCDGPFGSGIKSDHYTDEGALVVRLQNIRADGYYSGEPAYIDAAYFASDLNRHAVLPGDLLLAGLGDDNNLVGRACVAPPNLGPALVKADCFRFRLRTDDVDPEFAAYQLNCSAYADSGQLATGSTRSRIPLSVMATRIVAVPPLPEQNAIAAFLDRETAKIDDLVVEAESTITLLQERRTALISAAVTGKIDVRKAIARMEEATA